MREEVKAFIQGASMRPPRLCGGKMDNKTMVSPGAIRFNEAPAIMRGKERVALKERGQTHVLQ